MIGIIERWGVRREALEETDFTLHAPRSTLHNFDTPYKGRGSDHGLTHAPVHVPAAAGSLVLAAVVLHLVCLRAAPCARSASPPRHCSGDSPPSRSRSRQQTAAEAPQAASEIFTSLLPRYRFTRHHPSSVTDRNFPSCTGDTLLSADLDVLWGSVLHQFPDYHLRLAPRLRYSHASDHAFAVKPVEDCLDMCTAFSTATQATPYMSRSSPLVTGFEAEHSTPKVKLGLPGCVPADPDCRLRSHGQAPICRATALPPEVDRAAILYRRTRRLVPALRARVSGGLPAGSGSPPARTVAANAGAALPGGCARDESTRAAASRRSPAATSSSRSAMRAAVPPQTAPRSRWTETRWPAARIARPAQSRC